MSAIAIAFLIGMGLGALLGNTTARTKMINFFESLSSGSAEKKKGKKKVTK